VVTAAIAITNRETDRHPPVGLGEPGVITVAPENAIFYAVGARMRDLGIRPEAVLRLWGHDRASLCYL
jgi:CO/xanthine dehydrogenase Mo-binding subunit